MKIENDFLVFESTDWCKNKKITATNMSALLGLNKWKRKGDALLSIFGLYKETIDPFYTSRGAIAEKILAKMMTDKGYRIKTWDKYEINFDNFPQNKEFGGMIDIKTLSPIECIVECKSKNIKDFYNTKKYKNIDYEMQCQFYMYHDNCEKGKLIYIFFTDEQENEIRGVSKLSLDTWKVKVCGYDVYVDRKDFGQKLNSCLEYKNKCYTDRKIPLADISPKLLERLGLQ